MMMKKRSMSLQRSLLLAGALTVASVLPVTTALAAEDGEIGETSTGELDVTLDIEPLVRISNLDDLEFTIEGDWDGGDVSLSDEICVWSNTGKYLLTVEGDNGDGEEFFVENGDGDLVEYTATWHAPGDGIAPVLNGDERGGYDADDEDIDCGDGEQMATFEVTFAGSELQSAASGSYTDTLTLLVRPI